MPYNIPAKDLQAFINRSNRAGFCNNELNDFDVLCAKADSELFQKILNSPDHVLHPFLDPAPCSAEIILEVDRTTGTRKVQNAHLV